MRGWRHWLGQPLIHRRHLSRPSRLANIVPCPNWKLRQHVQRTSPLKQPSYVQATCCWPTACLALLRSSFLKRID